MNSTFHQDPLPGKSSQRSDYENAERPLGVMPKTYPDGFRVDTHRHARGQLIYASAGLMEVSSHEGLWLVPPQHALWMPAEVEHAMLAHGRVSLETLYIRADAPGAALPSQPRVFAVSAFLRSLISRAAAIPLDYAEGSHDAAVMALLPGEIAAMGCVAGLELMAARDKRLARVCRAILAAPGDPRGLEEWAAFAGASSRTLARLFQGEFGVTLTLWRQHVRILAAMPRLAAGDAVTAIAFDLGYDTPGAFSKVFRRFMGYPPSKSPTG
ncbi:helix-turn-helix transcriptional regulator [Janthinobacterium sp.]|uniref:AraC family transcriptional regulator n=1 Tax=Janthinobacterium sp. TaxID=1871054 RepID=UPI00293D1D62|nr:helix-turn-helix transcriptional regulator [Janthinobacterium sp.]